MRDAITLSAGFAVVGLGLYCLYSCTFALTTTLLALVAAVAANHLVVLLARLRLPRWAGILVVALCVSGGLVGLIAFVEPMLAAQTRTLIEALPKALRSLTSWSVVRRLVPNTAQSQLSQLAVGAATPALAAVGNVLTGAAALLTILILTVFMLIFGPPLINAALDWLPADRRHPVGAALAQIHDRVGDYLAGLLLICGINGALTTTFLVIFAPRYCFPLGLLSGLSSLVPYAGPLLTGTLISIFAAATEGIARGFLVAGYFVAYGQLEGNVLSPLILRKTTHANPLVILVALVFMGELAGVVGALLAVPIVISVPIVARLRTELWPATPKPTLDVK